MPANASDVITRVPGKAPNKPSSDEAACSRNKNIRDSLPFPLEKKRENPPSKVGLGASNFPTQGITSSH